MGVNITGHYLGNKRIELAHGPSGMRITTAAPVDNQGDGSSFSPTDLVAGALGACMLTIMAIVAERGAIELAGSWLELEKRMTAEAPRRIAAVPLVLHLPARLSAAERQQMETAAQGCPVYRSLDGGIEIPVEFRYDV